MKGILVLVDFSAPSINAAHYAASLAREKGFGEILLMANCFVPLFEQIVPSPDLLQVDADEILARMRKTQYKLDEVKVGIQHSLPAGFPIRTIIGAQSLLRSVLEQVAKESPSLVVIGTGNRVVEEDCSIGRQIIPLVKILPVPVLVIPAEARYQPVTSALIAGAAEPSQETREAFWQLMGKAQLLQRPPEKKDVLKSVLHTAAELKVQVIVALPGKHSFFYNLTHQNIMHGIVMNAIRPVLILK
jgi:nucleotide-binding universal stress UspA family protein